MRKRRYIGLPRQRIKEMLSLNINSHPDGWQEHSYVALCSTATYGDTHILKMNPQIDTVVTCLDHDSAGIEGNYRLKKHT